MRDQYGNGRLLRQLLDDCPGITHGSLTKKRPFRLHLGLARRIRTWLDYLRFLEMLLHGGSRDGVRILRPESVALMNQNHIADLPAGVLKTANPVLTNDVDFFPGAAIRWGLGYMLNLDQGPSGRSAGTLSWAGLFNSYYWLDPARRMTGVILTQILPFADPTVVRLYGEFERGVYALAETPQAA